MLTCVELVDLNIDIFLAVNKGLTAWLIHNDRFFFYYWQTLADIQICYTHVINLQGSEFPDSFVQLPTCLVI